MVDSLNTMGEVPSTTLAKLMIPMSEAHGQLCLVSPAVTGRAIPLLISFSYSPNPKP